MADSADTGTKFPISIPFQDSATLRISVNIQKIRALTSINELLRERRCLEHRRNSLLQSAVSRQHQVQELQNKCDSAWQQRLSVAQITGSKIQNECSSLRDRRDALQKQFISTIEGNMPFKAAHISPSIRANYKIQATLLQKDIAELKRRVLHAKLRLDSEIKAIDNLSNSVKRLRLELGTKKLNSMSIRPQTLQLLKHANQCRSSRENFRINVMKNISRTPTSIATSCEKRFN